MHSINYEEESMHQCMHGYASMPHAWLAMHACALSHNHQVVAHVYLLDDPRGVTNGLWHMHVNIGTYNSEVYDGCIRNCGCMYECPIIVNKGGGWKLIEA